MSAWEGRLYKANVSVVSWAWFIVALSSLLATQMSPTLRCRTEEKRQTCRDGILCGCGRSPRNSCRELLHAAQVCVITLGILSPGTPAGSHRDTIGSCSSSKSVLHVEIMCCHSPPLSLLFRKKIKSSSVPHFYLQWLSSECSLICFLLKIRSPGMS